MRSHAHKICVAVVAALGSLFPAVHAQNPAAYRIVVPFEFNYGATHLGPGSYRITADPLRHTLMIQNDVQSLIALARVTDHRSTMSNSTALFRRYGDRYFFEEFKVAGRATGWSVPLSRAQRRAARELARQRKEPTAMALALLPERTLGN